MTKKFLNVGAGLIILILLVCCSPKVYNTLQWQSKSILIDGQSNEWSNPLRYYDQSSKLSYELTNDDENLYVVFKSKEQSTIIKIMQKGLTFSIDTTKGKGRYPMQFTFPYKNPNDLNPFFEDELINNDPMMPPSRYTNDTLAFDHHSNDSIIRRKHTNNNFRHSMLKLLVKGINTKKDADSILDMPNSYGIEVAIKKESQFIFCELKIPFSVLYKNKLSAIDTIKPLFFQVQLKAIEPPIGLHHPPKDYQMSGSHGKMGGGNMGSPPGGGGGGMRPPPGSGGGFGPPPSNSEINSQNNENVIRFQFRTCWHPILIKK